MVRPSSPPVPFGLGDNERVPGTRRCAIPLALEEQPTLLVRVVWRDRRDLRDVRIAADFSHEGEVLDLPGAYAEGPGSQFGKFERQLHLTRVYATARISQNSRRHVTSCAHMGSAMQHERNITCHGRANPRHRSDVELPSDRS